MRNIVVLGCGFAGYHAAKRLEKSLVGRRRVQLTVVTQRDHFVFTPLLPGVASGDLEPDHLTTSIDSAFGPRTRVVIDDIEEVDIEARHLIGADHKIPFDYLLIATGGVRDPEIFDGAENVLGPDTLSDAIIIHDELETLCQSPDLPLRFGIIGGSTTGVEWAAELATALSNDAGLSARSEDLEIVLFEAGSRLLPDHSSRFAEVATDYLQNLGIELRLEERVISATSRQINVDEQTPEEFTRVFHCGGRVGALPWAGTNLAIDDRQRLLVDEYLGIPDTCGIYVAGDAAAPMADLPPSSNPQLALQQGQWAARNLMAGMSGRTKKPFKFEERGDFVTLGRSHAALELRGLVLEGKAAWLAYRLYYTALMPRPIEKKRLLRDWIADRIASDEVSPMSRRLADDEKK